MDEGFKLRSAFALPWSFALHSQAGRHALESEERAVACGLLTGDANDPDTERFRAFVPLDAHVYPYASLTALGVVGSFNQWLYFLDDQYDDHPETHSDLERIRGIMQQGYDLLCGMPMPDGAGPFVRFTRDVRRDLEALAPLGFFERFLTNVRQYLFDGTLVGLGHWVRRETLCLDEYVALRSLDSGVYPVVDCIEIASGLPLAPEVRQHPLIAAMGDLAVRHVALANDIFSYEKEVLINGSTMNLVHVLREREGLSVEGAAMQAVNLVNDLTRAFVRAEQTLPPFRPAWRDAVDAYITGLKTWMRGNVDFSLSSRRFRSGASPFAELREAEEALLSA